MGNDLNNNNKFYIGSELVLFWQWLNIFMQQFKEQKRCINMYFNVIIFNWNKLHFTTFFSESQNCFAVLNSFC